MGPFSDFAAAFHSHFSRHPNANLTKGIELGSDELPDPSLEHARALRAEALALSGRARQLKTQSQHTFDESLDLDLAELMLEAEAHSLSYEFNGRTALEQSPSAGSDVGNGLFLLLMNDPRPPPERLDAIIKRLRQVPTYVSSLLARLDTPVARWVDIDTEKVRGLGSLFESIERWADECGGIRLEELRAARWSAERALDGYLETLRSLPTTDSFAVGPRITESIIRLRGIEQAPDRLHSMAREFLAETAQHVEELRGRLVAKYGLARETSTESLQAFLDARYRLRIGGDFSRVIARYEEELARLVSFIEARNLFPLQEDQRLHLLRTPEFMAPSIPAGAMMSPAPFRSGTRTSFVYLTLGEELLDEHTELTIPSMMIHEGIPGHHLQLAAASCHASVVRRHMEAMDQAEGWTTFLEDYMLDIGYANALADEIRFCAKRDIGRIGARVAIDLFFMSGDPTYLQVGLPLESEGRDPFAAAGNLLSAITGFVPGRIEAELNWYSQERGYPLCYLTGNRLVRELRNDLARENSTDAFDADRAFFRAYLEAGNMPLAFLRRWFEARGLLLPSATSKDVASVNSRPVDH